MDHPRIDDEKVIDRYLRGELALEDEELFEEHLFACAGCLEQVQAGEALGQGLRTVAAEEATKELARVEVARGLARLGFLAWLRSRPLGQRLALTGLALALAALPVLWLREPGDVDGPRGDLLVVSLGVVRSAEESEAELRLDPEKSSVVLSLELPLAAAAQYHATLYDERGRELWRGEGLEPNLYGTLLIVVPSPFLAPGRYQVVLETPSAKGASPAGEVRFRVTAAGQDTKKGPSE